MKKNKNTYLVILLFFISGCDITESKKIDVYNDSDSIIFCIESTKSNFKFYDKSPLEYSIEVIGKDTIWKNNLNIIHPKEHTFFSDYNWKNTIDKCENKTFFLFIFKMKTLQKNDWQILREKVIYDRKISLSYDELEKINWKVIIKK